MTEQVIVVQKPSEPFCHKQKFAQLIAKGALIGGFIATLIAYKKSNIRTFIDARKRLSNKNFVGHTQKVALSGALKGGLLGLTWYTLYYQLLGMQQKTIDQPKTVFAYSMMGAITIGSLVNPALAFVGAYGGILIGFASVLKQYGLSYRAKGMQVQYKDVGEEQRRKIIGDYNLILLGQQYSLYPNSKFIMPQI